MIAAVPVDITVLIVAVLFFVVVANILIQLQAPARAAVNPIPLVGGWLAGNIDSVFNTFIRAATAAANASMGALAGAIDALNWGWGRLVANIAGIASVSVTLGVKIRDVMIPHAVALAAAYAAQAVVDAENYAYHLYLLAQTATTAAIGAAQAFMLARLSEAVSALLGRLQAAEMAIGVSEQYAIQQAAAMVGQEQAARLAQVAVAEGQAQSLFAQAVAVGAAAEAALRNDLGAEAQALGRTITTGLDSAQARAAAGDLLTAAAATGALAVVASAVQAIENSECQKFCNPLGGLGSLLDSLDMVAIFALMAAIEANPREAATVLQEVLGPIASTVESGAAAVGLKVA
jgi:hypothetical protein